MYSKQIEAELDQIERASIEDYLCEAGNMACLHTQLQDCDNILHNMEHLLGCFQTDLGNISGQIESLQQQSLAMNVKLKNRKEVQAALAVVVDGMAVSADLVEVIYNSPVNEEFLAALHVLDNKLAFVAANGEDKACTAEVNIELTRLLTKAAAKLRDFFMQKICAVRKPMSNPQLSQNAMLKVCDGFRFLAQHDRAFATEVRDEYVDTLGKVHFSYFKTYLSRLMKLEVGPYMGSSCC